MKALETVPSCYAGQSALHRFNGGNSNAVATPGASYFGGNPYLRRSAVSASSAARCSCSARTRSTTAARSTAARTA